MEQKEYVIWERARPKLYTAEMSDRCTRGESPETFTLTWTVFAADCTPSTYSLCTVHALPSVCGRFGTRNDHGIRLLRTRGVLCLTVIGRFSPQPQILLGLQSEQVRMNPLKVRARTASISTKIGYLIMEKKPSKKTNDETTKMQNNKT